MKQYRLNIIAGSLFLTTGLMAAASAYADEDRFTFNGFGNQDYRKSTANSYLGADSSGTWANNFLGLVVSAKINERTRAWAQLQAGTGEDTRFTWAFVDYQFNDSVSGHAGRVKFPYGLYNETIKTQALRPSISEPAAYSQAADMTYDAYDGVGLDWHTGPVLLQVFGGNIYTPPAGSGPAYLDPDTTQRDVNVFGGRVTWNTPIDGMRLMVSANRTTTESFICTGGLSGTPPTCPSGNQTNTPSGEKGSEDRAMLSFDYVAHDLDLKAEYNFHTTPTLLNNGTSYTHSAASYVQAAYDIDKFLPFVRYDYVSTDLSQKSNPAYYQKIWVAGVGYKLADNLNLRFEQDYNRGYALCSGDLSCNGPGSPVPNPVTNWNTTMLSVNFMF
jgi:hypothetical protein